MRNSGAVPADLLTHTEYRVLALIGLGRTSKEVATALQISILTVGDHRRNICRKLNLHSTAELASFGALYLGRAKMSIPLGTACCVKLHLRNAHGGLTVSYKGALARNAKVASVALGALVFNF